MPFNSSLFNSWTNSEFWIYQFFSWFFFNVWQLAALSKNNVKNGRFRIHLWHVKTRSVIVKKKLANFYGVKLKRVLLLLLYYHTFVMLVWTIVERWFVMIYKGLRVSNWTPAILARSSVSSSSCWPLRYLAKLRAAISSASSICCL